MPRRPGPARVLLLVLVVAALVGAGACGGAGGSGARPPGGADAGGADTDGADTGGGTEPGADAGPGRGEALSAVPAARPPLEGFGEVAVRLTPPGAATRTWCALLAADAASRARGLMGRDDLVGYDAMVFAFDEPVEAAFYMRNTPLPLSIAFFDGAGAFVSATDMAPCPDGEGCPTYEAGGPFRFALEVPQGDLHRLGAVPGSHLDVGGPCPS